MLLWMPARHEPGQVVRHGADHPQISQKDPNRVTDALNIFPPGWVLREERHSDALVSTGLSYKWNLSHPGEALYQSQVLRLWGYSGLPIASYQQLFMEVLSLDLRVSQEIAAAPSILS